MLLLGVVTALQGGGGVNLAHLGMVLVQAVGFVLVVAIVGTRLARKRGELLDAPINPLSPLTLSLAVCLGLAALASKLGLAAIIGAFLAGMVAAEQRHRFALEHQIQPLMAFLVPFFFVVTGTQVEIKELANPPALLALVVVVALAVVGKLVGCGLGARSLGKASALVVGVGMIPRGEVGIIVAALGRTSGIFNDQVFALIVAMSLITSVLAPPILKRLLANLPPDEPTPEETEETNQSLLVRVDGSGYTGH
jgi:Kef-type K+ transport system membrane component KefB